MTLNYNILGIKFHAQVTITNNIFPLPRMQHERVFVFDICFAHGIMTAYLYTKSEDLYRFLKTFFQAILQRSLQRLKKSIQKIKSFLTQ